MGQPAASDQTGPMLSDRGTVRVCVVLKLQYFYVGCVFSHTSGISRLVLCFSVSL